MRSATQVRVFVGEDERYRGGPLFEAIVLAAREQGLAGATVFRAHFKTLSATKTGGDGR